MITLINSKRTPPPPRRGTFNHRLKQFGPPCAAFLFALLLAACPNPGDTTTGGGTSTGGTDDDGTPGGGGTGPAAYTTTVTGTIQDASRPGVGLPGAKVTASTAPDAPVETRSDGSFSIEVKNHPGQFTLTVEKACYETPAPKSITVRDNTPYDAKTTALTPGPEPEGNDRFTLTPPGGPTYTLTIADCVRTIAAGEFTPVPVKVTDPNDPAAEIDAVTRLDGLLGSSGQRNKVRAIILPESLVSIGEKAFHNHYEVNGELNIPASVDSIEKHAFSYLGSGAVGRGGSVKFAPNSKLRKIGESAFNSSIIDTVSPLPSTLETIGIRAFFSANFGIRSSDFIIPENVESVGFGAFAVGAGGDTPRVSGKLTVKSSKLTRTPDDTTQTKKGTLGNSLFKTVLVGTKPVNPFTTIALHEAVFNSYTKDDLEFIFGTGGRYVDIQDESRELTKP